MKKLLKISGLLLLGVSISGSNVFAAVTANFTVNATVIGACEFSTTPTSLSFGSNLVPGQIVSSTAISQAAAVTCNTGTTLSVSMASAHYQASAPFYPQMSGASGALLPYQLFSDNASTKPWFGSATPPTQTFPITIGTAIPIPVYGTLTVPYTATPPIIPQAYSDIVTITITYT